MSGAARIGARGGHYCEQYGRLVLCWLAALLVACQPKPDAMNEKETNRMKTLTDQLMPRCVGRYVISLPQEFVINPIHRSSIEEVAIQIEPMKEHVFDLDLQARSAELRRERIMGDETLSLKTVIPLTQALGSVFDRSRTGESRALRTLELLAWRDGYKFEMTIEARDMSAARRTFEGDTRKTDVPEKLAHLLDIFQRTRGLAEGEVPTEPGVCIRHGFVRGAASELEDVEITYQLKGAEDGYFTFRTIGDLKQDNELLDRGAAIEADLKKVGVAGRTLRKGTLKFKGLAAQEWLLTRKGEAIMLHDFTLEANSKIASAKTPVVMIDFVNGGRAPHLPRTTEESATLKPLMKATFTEAEAIALWDAVVPTLTPRPGAF
jgi:hypothetical protein